MPSRNWLFVAAIGGCLVAAVALGQESPEEDRAVHERASQQPDEQHPSPEPDDKDAAWWAERDGSPQTYRAICEHPKNHEQADLCQQWRTAEAAEKQASYALGQLIASAAGIAGLVISLFFTGWAAIAASRAAKSAERSLMRERGRIVIALDPLQPGIQPGLDEIGVRYRLHNAGASFVHINEVSIRLQEFNEIPTFPPYGPAEPLFAALKADERSHAMWLSLPNGSDIAQRKPQIILFGYVKFVDAFHDEHTTKFGLQFDWDRRLWLPVMRKHWNRRSVQPDSKSEPKN